MTHRLIRGVLASIVLMTTTLVIFAPFASAQEQYHLRAFDCGGTRGSGQVDNSGNLYVPCSSKGGLNSPRVEVWSAAGTLVRTIPLTAYATSVAPSPDGSVLYIVTGHVLKRVVRQATGVYVLDTLWKVDTYPQWGAMYQALGEFVKTDAQGNIYFSSGTWTASPSSIIKYSPAGRMITQFGAWEKSWALGVFYWINTGLAVTRDGSSIYVAEDGNNRVQRFARQADGSYAPAGVVVGNDPATDADPYEAQCGATVRDGRLAAPYDVGLDAVGNLYVLNTSCLEVKKFTAGGAFLYRQQLTNTRGGHVHGMAVDGAGRVYLPEVGTIMDPGAAPVVPVTPAIKWIADSYRGWAKATSRTGAATVPAWRWTATGWIATSLTTGSWVSVQPFAAGWMWAWRADTWYAMRTADIAEA